MWRKYNLLKSLLMKLKSDIVVIANEYYPALEDYDYDELAYTIKLIDMILVSEDYLYVPVVRQQVLSISDYFSVYFESNLDRRIKELANNFNSEYNDYIENTFNEKEWFK